MRRLCGSACVCFVLFVVMLSAAAVKPTGTLSLNQLSPHVGDSITFTVSVANMPSGGGSPLSEAFYAFVEVSCTQSGVNVFEGYTYAQPTGDYKTYTSTTYPLQLAWASGGADCSAFLFYDRISRNYNGTPSRTNSNTLASQNFFVAP
jgi:hypothetical protein